MNPSSIGNATNYLVPSSGQTHYVAFSGAYSATPEFVDFRTFQVDNFPFQPQGAFVDNTAGAGPLTINIQPINFNVVIPAGVGAQVQFPAPNGQTHYITGSGQATIVYVDFPVLPNAGLVDIGNTVQVNIASITGGVTIPVAPTIDAQGLPYRVKCVPNSVLYGHVQLSGVTATGSYTPTTSNLELRKLIVSISSNASLAAAGIDTLTVQANGSTIYTEGIYLPAVAGSGGVPLYEKKIDFDGVAAALGTGNVTVTLGTALATGQLDANIYVG